MKLFGINRNDYLLFLNKRHFAFLNKLLFYDLIFFIIILKFDFCFLFGQIYQDGPIIGVHGYAADSPAYYYATDIIIYNNIRLPIVCFNT